MVIWLVHYDICHGYLQWDITAIVVSVGKVSDASGTFKLPHFRFHLFLFPPHLMHASMHERKLISSGLLIKIQWQSS